MWVYTVFAITRLQTYILYNNFCIKYAVLLIMPIK